MRRAAPHPCFMAALPASPRPASSPTASRCGRARPSCAPRVQRRRAGRDLERRRRRVRGGEGQGVRHPRRVLPRPRRRRRRSREAATKLSVPIRTKTTLRAEWKEAESPTVVVTPRANVRLTKEPGGLRGRLVPARRTSVDGKEGDDRAPHGRGLEVLQTVVLKAARLRPVGRRRRSSASRCRRARRSARCSRARRRGLLPGRIQQAHPNVEEAT